MLQLGSTAIGVKTKEGVVLSVEKRVTSTLLVSITFQPRPCTLQSCSAQVSMAACLHSVIEHTVETSSILKLC